MQSFDAAGSPRWPSNVGAAIAIRAQFGIVSSPEPVLATDGAGGAFVCAPLAWFDGTWDIACQHVGPSGELLWGDSGRSVKGAPDADQVLSLRIVDDGAGGILVFWKNYGPMSPEWGPSRMEGQRLTATGDRAWGPSPLLVKASPAGATSELRIAPDGSGGALLAFSDRPGDGEGDAYTVSAQRVSREGRLLWGGAVALPPAYSHEDAEEITPSGDGGAFVIVRGRGDTGPGRLRIHRLDPGGEPAWPAGGVPLSNPRLGGDAYSAFAAFDEGVLRVAFTEQGEWGAWDLNVRFAAFDGEGRRLADALLARTGRSYLRGLAFSPTLGGVFAVWEDWSRGYPDGFPFATALADPPICPERPCAAAPCRAVAGGSAGTPLLPGR